MFAELIIVFLPEPMHIATKLPQHDLPVHWPHHRVQNLFLLPQQLPSMPGRWPNLYRLQIRLLLLSAKMSTQRKLPPGNNTSHQPYNKFRLMHQLSRKLQNLRQFDSNMHFMPGNILFLQASKQMSFIVSSAANLRHDDLRMCQLSRAMFYVFLNCDELYRLCFRIFSLHESMFVGWSVSGGVFCQLHFAFLPAMSIRVLQLHQFEQSDGVLLVYWPEKVVWWEMCWYLSIREEVWCQWSVFELFRSDSRVYDVYFTNY